MFPITTLSLALLGASNAAWVVDPTFTVAIPPSITVTALTAVALDEAAGDVFIAQHGEPGVIVLDESGKYSRDFGTVVLDTPHGLRTRTVDSELQVWVADFGHTGRGSVVRHFKSDGTLVSTIGTPGNNGSSVDPKSFQMDSPADIAFAADGTVLVCDGDGGPNHRVARFSLHGAASADPPNDWTMVRYWGGKGTAAGQFNIPHNVRMDSCQRLWVADRVNNRTQVGSQLFVASCS